MYFGSLVIIMTNIVCCVSILLILFIFNICRRNQKSHVTTNLVHKLYRIQSIALQPLQYFENLVSKEDIAASKAKQKSSKRTWYTLTVESLNLVLYQIIIYFLYFNYNQFFF
jgi:hypothetical protein